jgi:cytidylate kinase
MLADRLHFTYLDTGAMYRAVALQASRLGIDFEDGFQLKKMCREMDLQFTVVEGFNRLLLGKEDISSAIRSPEMDMLSSDISSVKEVREAMTELQRKIGAKGGLVAEGRDMGTVVFPGADHKFFITANLRERAHRRFKERMERGESVTRADVERDLRERDLQDQSRDLAPLKAAEDAHVIDTTRINPQEVAAKIMDMIKEG